LLEKINSEEPLDPDEVQTLGKLDRCLRFFVVCAVLDKGLKIERKSLLLSYDYYVGILVNNTKAGEYNRTELIKYVKDYYPTLLGWATDKKNQKLLNKLQPRIKASRTVT